MYSKWHSCGTFPKNFYVALSIQDTGKGSSGTAVKASSGECTAWALPVSVQGFPQHKNGPASHPEWVLLALDRKEVVFLVLLDLSSAFDTIDHTLLLETLKTRFGISGQALSWFRSYLTDRFQTVCIDGSFSHKQKLDCGVLQGSVLGPQLFTLSSSPVADIARQHNLGVQLYADDSQLYLGLQDTWYHSTVGIVEDCVDEIRSWMIAHKLMMNQEKTIIIQLTPSERWHLYWNFQHFWSRHPCHSCRTQFRSAVG